MGKPVVLNPVDRQRLWRRIEIIILQAMLYGILKPGGLPTAVKFQHSF